MSIRKSPKPIPHGELSSYTNRGCRCDECKAEMKMYMRQYTIANPHYKIVGKYGISPAQRSDMANDQDGRCAICRSGERALVIDHSHQTNTVRALLCSQCNIMIGMAQESPTTLRYAADYLELHA